MKRPISREAHGFAELAFIPFTTLSPELLRYKDNGRASRFARMMGGLMLGSALMAKTEWGLVKKVPFKAPPRRGCRLKPVYYNGTMDRKIFT